MSEVKSSPTHTNDLISSTSPYLLQHAHNPVNWMPWNKQAQEKANAEQKLMIISIGYSACHWCHVMERESFENEEVAKLMNAHFVSIKVDREERPDVDQVYMDAANVLTGSGGWPLNAITLPDGRPIYAGTYFPKERWMSLLDFFQDLWKNEPHKLVAQAEAIGKKTAGLDISPPIDGQVQITTGNLDLAISNWLPKIDGTYGGRRGAPKFPMPRNYIFLLQQYARTKDQALLKAITTGLDGMMNGGIYDHVDGGFARYSVDERWHIPHFEKMLYDNAQLIAVYAEAYQLTKNKRYKQVVDETIAFMKRDWSNGYGGYYAAFDADSEGVEGKFYAWTANEITAILGDDTAWFDPLFDIHKGNGNWGKGVNVLQRIGNESTIFAKHNLDEKDIQAAMQKLFAIREKRVKPSLDDKSILAWNALQLNGLTKAADATGNKAYLELANKTAAYILKHHKQKDGSYRRNFKNGITSTNGFLDDYALTADAFITLYQSTFKEKYLLEAMAIAQFVMKYFYDKESNYFFYTSNQDEALISRKKEMSDNVIPASNSVMMNVLYNLGLYFEKSDYLEIATKAVKGVKESAISNGPFYGNWLLLMDKIARPYFEIAIVGNNWDTLKSELNGHYIPNAIFLGGKTEGQLPLLENKLSKGNTLIYVCVNKSCKRPVDNAAEALELLK